ncbi:MAG TPA: DUF4397 domain-containing protein [Spirosoma sp.]|jgi:hypothetical protein|nr:DUF4397 domain-containing protein [Spirosoma sp.]
MNTFSKTILSWVVAGVVVAGTLIGCQDPDYATPTPATGPRTSTARALFVNASPNSPALNFLVENVSVAQSLTSGQSSSYVSVPTGNIQLRAKAATGAIGGTLGSNDILFRAGATNQNNFGAIAGTSYTVFVTDTIQRPVPTTPAGTSNPGGLQFLTVTDPLTQTLTAGAGGVRFFHLAPDLGLPASTTVTTPQVASLRLSSPTSSSVALANRAYRNVTANTFTSVPAGTYRVDVFTGATAPPTSSTIAPVASTTVNVEATKLYTLYARGLRRANTLSVGQVQHN